MATQTCSRERSLNHEEKVRLGLLVLPTFALALSITLVSSYLGKVIERYTTETIVVGVIVGSEGIMALWIPLVAGSWSDQLRTRIGGTAHPADAGWRARRADRLLQPLAGAWDRQLRES